MTDEEIREIYFTMLGQQPNSPWAEYVENIYRDGSACDSLYGEVYDANRRLVARLGGIDEDLDVEIIVGNLLRIAQIKSYEMFRAGLRVAKAKKDI